MMSTIRKKSGITALVLLALFAGWAAGQAIFSASPAQASLYWFHNVRNKEISVCFAGNAVDIRPDRVREIVGHLQQFEYAANIRFLTIDGVSVFDAAASGGDIQKLACPAPVSVGGKDYYAGDIRVALWNTNVPVDPPGMVPGDGCTQALVGSSWSNPPDELDAKRPCQYNLKLGDDDTDPVTGQHTGTPWLNHTLHEFGHALGLSHEHARSDIDPACGVTGSESNGWITATWDRDSVMNYVMLDCQAYGNYANSGLSAGDKLALHIMYPEDARTAEFTGKTVVKTGEALILRSTLVQQGAASFAIKNFQWLVDGAVKSTSDTLNITFSTPGNHTFQFTYQDFLGRDYNYTGTIHVLDAASFNEQMAAVEQAQLLMMTSSLPSYVYLPAVMR